MGDKLVGYLGNRRTRLSISRSNQEDTILTIYPIKFDLDNLEIWEHVLFVIYSALVLEKPMNKKDLERRIEEIYTEPQLIKKWIKYFGLNRSLIELEKRRLVDMVIKPVMGPSWKKVDMQNPGPSLVKNEEKTRRDLTAIILDTLKNYDEEEPPTANDILGHLKGDPKKEEIVVQAGINSGSGNLGAISSILHELFRRGYVDKTGSFYSLMWTLK